MYSVPSTSALVLLWTKQSIYDSVAAKKFFRKVNLDAGEPLRKELEIKGLNLPEEITNRKYGVKKFCTNFLKACPDGQVVFLGAGLDPKSLDVAEAFPNSSIFDVDMENMDVKEQITKEIQGPKNIRFCNADIGACEEMKTTLKNHGWNENKKTLLVAEGISYYVPKVVFKKALNSLKTHDGGIILEYSIPHEEFPRQGYKIFFEKLQQLLKTNEQICCYSVDEVNLLSEELGGNIVKTMDQTMLEKERTGKNAFYDVDAGCVRVSFIQF